MKLKMNFTGNSKYLLIHETLFNGHRRFSFIIYGTYMTKI